jgi:hypothetical protein
VQRSALGRRDGGGATPIGCGGGRPGVC